MNKCYYCQKNKTPLHAICNDCVELFVDIDPFLELQKKYNHAMETNKKLHIRTQQAESAFCEWRKFSELTKGQATGRFYPAMMRWALTKQEEIITEAIEKITALGHNDRVFKCTLWPVLNILIGDTNGKDT